MNETRIKMEYLVSYLLISLMFFVSLNKCESPWPAGINATVYYETGCPYDKSFIEQQLNPILEGNLSNYVNLQLLSFDSKPKKYPTYAIWICYDDSRGTCHDDLDIIKKDPESVSCLKFLMCYLRKLKEHFEYEPIESADDFCSISSLGHYHFAYQTCRPKELKLHFKKPNNTFGDETLDKIDLKSNLKPEEKNVAITTINWEMKSVCMDRVNRAKASERGVQSDRLKAEKIKLDESSAGAHALININNLVLGFFVYLSIHFYYNKVE
ncbi:uncharacterized protein LOC126881246 isoform X4 [Diabrotica virgifera virgifera]|uniref:Gamma-interferon-inducible lysosomal thiol reductase-like n=1 Tax=Diabrotica virgifera virgifera TaxID=50390 RepID=A0ABM5JTT8_DIAVI|nr:uncharacterized protein LOC126881246 isoform X4 [Diabrotica virgifera virgifera]